MNFFPHFLLLLSSFFSSPFSELKDLEEKPDAFVLETKQIKIEKYPDAFNPSMVRHQKSILMIFRIRDHILKTTNQMGLVLLDDDYNRISEPYLIEVRGGVNQNGRSMAQDPRLITLGQDVFVVFNDLLDSPYKNIRRMLVSKLQFDGETYFIENPEMLTLFDNETRYRHEKNWAPFVYHGKLLLTYSLQPHSILKPIRGENRCETISSTKTNFSWS